MLNKINESYKLIALIVGAIFGQIAAVVAYAYVNEALGASLLLASACCFYSLLNYKVPDSVELNTEDSIDSIFLGTSTYLKSCKIDYYEVMEFGDGEIEVWRHIRGLFPEQWIFNPMQERYRWVSDYGLGDYNAAKQGAVKVTKRHGIMVTSMKVGRT